MSGAAESPTATVPTLRRTLAAGASLARERLTSTLRAVAFWAAAALPLAYVPFVVGSDLGGASELLLGLLALHAVCLVFGHEHAPAASA